MVKFVILCILKVELEVLSELEEMVEQASRGRSSLRSSALSGGLVRASRI
jgi:hypothetical protein